MRSFARVLPPTLEETAFPALVSLFSTLRSALGAPPAVILSEDLTAAPEATLRVRTGAARATGAALCPLRAAPLTQLFTQALCGALGLPFDPATLSWPAGPRPEDGLWAPWWYASTHASTGFQVSSEAGPSMQPPLAPALADLVAECRPFYDLLAKHALRPPTLAAPPAPPAPLRVDVGDSAAGTVDGAAAPQHQGATHSYAADPRNATVLVGASRAVLRCLDGLLDALLS